MQRSNNFCVKPFQLIFFLWFLLSVLGSCAQNKYEILEEGREAHYSAQEQWAFLLNNATDFKKLYTLIHGQNVEPLSIDFRSNVVLAIFEPKHDPAVDFSVSELLSNQKDNDLSLKVNFKLSKDGGVDSPYILIQINRRRYQAVNLLDDQGKLIHSYPILSF